MFTTFFSGISFAWNLAPVAGYSFVVKQFSILDVIYVNSAVDILRAFWPFSFLTKLVI
jgi:hypothetical protein